jgi:hypothetical protein
MLKFQQYLKDLFYTLQKNLAQWFTIITDNDKIEAI